MNGRDPSIDTLRAVAIAGVVGGHWLVTGLVLDHDGVLRPATPLAAMPALAPLTWLFQTLGLFFFAGGFAAARSHARRAPGPGGVAGSGPAGSAAPIPRRLLRPVAVLAGGWTVALGAAAAAGVPSGTLRTVAVLVISPLWFLLPYLALSAATGPLARLVDRAGPAAALIGVPVVAASDLGLAPGWAAVAGAWSVPWTLGIAAARGRLHGGARLALTGAGALAVLVTLLGYPVSAVGVPGAGRSNLDPPSLAAIALAVAQIGVFLQVRQRLCRTSGAIGAVNRRAVPIYLAHQSVLILVTAAAALVSPAVPGLLTAPDGPAWVLQRIAWLPVFAAVLAVVAGLGGTRTGGDRHGRRAPAH